MHRGTCLQAFIRSVGICWFYIYISKVLTIWVKVRCLWRRHLLLWTASWRNLSTHLLKYYAFLKPSLKTLYFVKKLYTSCETQIFIVKLFIDIFITYLFNFYWFCKYTGYMFNVLNVTHLVCGTTEVLNWEIIISLNSGRFPSTTTC